MAARGAPRPPWFDSARGIPPNRVMGKAFPPKGRMHHEIPAWVPVASDFHVRIRTAQTSQGALTTPDCAFTLMKSAALYHANQRWWCHLFLLMPDHLHALLAFPPGGSMSRIIGDWKHYHTVHSRISWQEGYFDHRIRNSKEFALKAGYIRQNPVAKGYIERKEDWPWVCSPMEDGIFEI